jgi:hypothetical protein
MALLGAGCARCGRPYGAEGVRVLAQREEIAFVQLVCSACQIQTLALVTGIAALERDEAAADPAPAGTAPVSEADVLEMRSFLADYQGDLRTLLER